MAICEMTPTHIRRVEETTFDEVDKKERGDLQRLLRAQIGVVAPDCLVISEEFCDWEESKRRIDLLALDREANLVVIELKRTEDGGHMELQAIRYAAIKVDLPQPSVRDEPRTTDSRIRKSAQFRASRATADVRVAPAGMS